MLNKPSDILEQDYSTLSLLTLRKDKIITLETKEGVTEQSIDSMKEDFQIFKKWTKNEKLGFIVDSRNLNKFNVEMRLFAQKNSALIFSKYAIIINSGISSFIANIFLYLNRPNIPTKIFINKTDAINWLKLKE